MRRCVRIAFFLLVLLPSMTSFAKHNGNVCVPIANDVPKIDRDQYGVHNTSPTSEAVVYCPIDRRSLSSSDPEWTGSNLAMKVYDRNTTVDVSCTLLVLNTDGNVIFSNTQHTSTWSWSSMQLVFPSFTEQTVSNMEIQCTVPRTETGLSYIASVYWIIP